MTLNQFVAPLMAVSAWFAFGAVEALAEQEKRKSKAGIVGVVGKWSETADGDGVVRGDGAAGTVGESAAAAAAKSLFGNASSAFVANATSPAAFALAVLPDAQRFSAGVYKAQFQLVSGASDQTAGLVFDLQPTGEYLFVRYNTREGNVALWRYADGKREVVARTSDKVQLPLGEWHDIALTINGSRIIGLVNNSMRLEHDLGREPAGRIGFWTKRDSVTMFRQISVVPAAGK